MSPADETIAIGNQTLKVSLGAHRGRVIFDIRYQYQPADGGRLKPTRRGVTIHAAALPDVIHALEKLKALMIHDGALDEGNPPRFHPSVYPSDF